MRANFFLLNPNQVYLAVCFWMVFGALLEYATVSYAGKRIKLNISRWEEFNRKVTDIKAEMKRQSNGDYQVL